MLQATAKGAMLGTSPCPSARVDLPRSLLAHFSQPEVHVSVDAVARLLGFAGEKEFLRFVSPLLKQVGHQAPQPGAHIGALSFKRCVALCAGKTPAARKLLEELLLSADLVNLPSRPQLCEGAIPRWPACSPEDMAMDQAPFERLHHYLNWRTKMRHFAGISCGVVKNGMLVYYQDSGYANVDSKVKMGGDTLVRLFSMTKSLVAAAFMTYLEDSSLGIDLDDPVGKYIPAFRPEVMSVLPKRGQKGNQPLEKAITLRQLLTHTSGIGYGATLDDPWPPAKGSYYKIYEDLCDRTRDGSIKNLEEWCNALAKVPLKGQPGHYWDYSYSLDVLGRVLEIVAGKPLDQVVEERICRPLKMRDTSFVVPPEKAHRIGPWYKSVEVDGKPNFAHQLEVVDKGGEESGWVGENASRVLSGGGTVEVPLDIKGGMVSTFNDYLRFLMMIRNFGELDGVRILQRETVQLMICNHIPAACNGKKTVFVFDKPGVGYSCLGQIQALHPKQDKGSCSGEFGWGGLAGPCWTIDPRTDMIVLSVTQTAFVLDHEEYVRYAARRAIHQHIYGSVNVPTKATSYAPESFDLVRPKDNSKDEQASLDKEFEEEHRLTKLTRSRTAKERAILPGARLDRHPSDEAEATSGETTSGLEPDATPVKKRRTSASNSGGEASTEQLSPGSAQNGSRGGSSKGGPPSPSRQLADPLKPESLLFSRVTVPVISEDGKSCENVPPQKARVMAVDGDAVEVVTEGNWSTRNVKLDDLAVIDESQFGKASARKTDDPTEFPAPRPNGSS